MPVTNQIAGTPVKVRSFELAAPQIRRNEVLHPFVKLLERINIQVDLRALGRRRLLQHGAKFTFRLQDGLHLSRGALEFALQGADGCCICTFLCHVNLL